MMNNKGQSLVEFALILLLLLSILFGITEFGRAWFHSNALINGVRSGARYGSTLNNLTTNDIRVRAYTFGQVTSAIPSLKPNTDLFVNVSTYNNGVAMKPRTGTGNEGIVKVIVYENFNILTGSIIPFFNGQRTLIRQTTMRYQGS